MKIDPSAQQGRLAGIVTTAELVAAGFSDARIRTLIRRGVFVALSRGIYADPGLVDQIGKLRGGSSALSATLAILSAGPSAVASHRYAADIHGIDLLRRPSADAVTVTRSPDPPMLLVP